MAGVARISKFGLFFRLNYFAMFAGTTEKETIVNAVKNQAIDSSINLAKDLVSGKGIKESLKDEFENVKENTKRKVVTIGSNYLKENNSVSPPKRGKKNLVKEQQKAQIKKKA